MAIKSKDLVIDREFVLNTSLADLRDILFVEDNKGIRYRERIMDRIKEIGVEEWFKLKRMPTDGDSVWKNRYTGSETTLGQQINGWGGPLPRNIERQGFYIWESYLPIGIWIDKHLHAEYKENPTLDKFGGSAKAKVKYATLIDEDECEEECEAEEVEAEMPTLASWC